MSLPNSAETDIYSSKKSEGQKNRVGVACTRCRERKVRCDGARPKCSQCERSERENCVYMRVSPAVTDASRKRKRDLWLRRSIDQLVQSGNLSRQSSVRPSTSAREPQDMRPAYPTSVALGDINATDVVRRRHSATSIFEALLASRATAAGFDGSIRDKATQIGQPDGALDLINCAEVATTLPQSTTTSSLTLLDKNTSDRAPGRLQAALSCLASPAEQHGIPLLLGSVSSSQPKISNTDTSMLDLNHNITRSSPILWDTPASNLSGAWEDIFSIDDLYSHNALGLFPMEQSSIGDGSSAIIAASTSSSIFSSISGSDTTNTSFQTGEVEAQEARPSPNAVLIGSSCEKGTDTRRRVHTEGACASSQSLDPKTSLGFPSTSGHWPPFCAPSANSIPFPSNSNMSSLGLGLSFPMAATTETAAVMTGQYAIGHAPSNSPSFFQGQSPIDIPPRSTSQVQRDETW